MTTENSPMREDASTFSLHYLKRLVGKGRFESLDFSTTSIDVINELIPPRPSGATLDPPPPYRISAQRIRDWRRLGKAAQEQEATRLVTQEKATKPTKRGQRKRDYQEILTASIASNAPFSPQAQETATGHSSPPHSNNGDASTDETTMQESSDTVMVPASIASNAPFSPQAHEDFTESSSPSHSNNGVVTSDETMMQESSDTVMVPATPCFGINIQTLRRRARKNIEIKVKGFKHLTGEAMRVKGTRYSNDLSWSFQQDPFVLGTLVNGSDRNAELSVTWICRQHTNDQRLETMVSADDGKYDSIAFHHALCLGTCNGSETLCTQCSGALFRFSRLCKEAVDIRESTFKKNGTRNDQLLKKSPSLLDPKLKESADEFVAIRREKYNIERARKRAEARKVELNLSDETKAVLFNSSELEKLQEKYLSNELIERKDLCKCLFQESLVHARTIEKSGKKACRYSPLYTRMSIMLRGSGMNLASYDFFCNVFNLPVANHLQQYRNIDTNTPDGIMYEALGIARQQFIDTHGHDVPIDDWLRMVSLAFDAFTIRDKLMVDMHTNEIVGAAADAFEFNVILDEFERMMNDEDEEESSAAPVEAAATSTAPDEAAADEAVATANTASAATTATTATTATAATATAATATGESRGQKKTAASKKKKTDKDTVPLGKHMLCFFVTTWDYNSQRTQFMVARWCMSSMTAQFLIPKIRLILSECARFGFNINNLAADGATENRSSFKQLATKTVKDVFPELARKVKNGQEKFIPSKLKVAFNHPIPSLSHNLVFIGSDMPHAVKKFCNALEMSGKEDHARCLEFRGLPLSLKMLYDVWLQTPDSQSDGRSSLTVYKFTTEHFIKNAFNRMRSFLAFHIFGTTMYGMIEEYGPKVPGAAANTYDSIKEIILVTDRYIDIVNGHNKDCENINSANHRHLDELLGLVRTLTEWKQEAGDNKDRFIPVSTYEDLCWGAFSLIGIAKTQLPEGRAMVQKRSGSDICERTYGKVRGKNPNPTSQDARGILAHAQAANMQTFSGHSKTNTAGDKAILRSEVTGPLPKRPKKNKK